MHGNAGAAEVGSISKIVQSRVSPKALELLEAKAKSQAISLAAHIRRVLYRDLGLIEGE